MKKGQSNRQSQISVRSAKKSPAPSYKGSRPASDRASAAARGASRKAGTRCEVKLRGALWRLGARYRKNVATLPGKPDIVFPRVRLAVYCDGDFWHGHHWDERKQRLSRGHNAAYWQAKIQRNIERDREHTGELESTGWTVLRFWESDIHRDPDGLARRVLAVLRSLTARGR